MRGKASGADTSWRIYGITPAYAGKRNCTVTQCLLLQDHPRLCGEKHHGHPKRLSEEGSPPPMRGKGEIVKTMVGDTGITPAYAGKRS